MKVEVTVTLTIELCDDDLGDPVKGDPLEQRMINSAAEAVSNALARSEQYGFAHDLESLTSVLVDAVTVKAI